MPKLPFHYLGDMKYIREEQDNKDKILKAFEDVLGLVGLDNNTFGVYLIEKTDEDRNIHHVKQDIVEKEEYLDRKHILHAVEYLALLLTKQR